MKVQQKKIRLTEAQLRALKALENQIQTRINFKSGKNLSQKGLAVYLRNGVFRITAEGISYLRGKRDRAATLGPRRKGARGCRRNAWVHIQPSHIQRQREAYGLTQRELGQLVGVSRQTIAFWEANRWSATLEHQQALCDIFDNLKERGGK